MDKNVEIIGKIEALLQELKNSLGVGDSRKKKVNIKASADRFSGLTAEIFNLVQEGYFKEPKEISEIEKKLHQRAINKPTTSLMKPLRLLIRKRILDREKPNGKGRYKYFEGNK